MPLSSDELKDSARVDLHKSVEEALRHPIPAGSIELDIVIEKCIRGALRKIESGFSDLDRALGRRVARSALHPASEEHLEKADNSTTRGLIKSALRSGQVVSGARRNR